MCNYLQGERSQQPPPPAWAVEAARQITYDPSYYLSYRDMMMARAEIIARAAQKGDEGMAGSSTIVFFVMVPAATIVLVLATLLALVPKVKREMGYDAVTERRRQTAEARLRCYESAPGRKMLGMRD